LLKGICEWRHQRGCELPHNGGEQRRAGTSPYLARSDGEAPPWQILSAPAVAAGRVDAAAAALQRRGTDAGGSGQCHRGRNHTGKWRSDRDLQRRVAARWGIGSGDADLGGSGLKLPSRQCLAQDGGRAQFHPPTPSSSGRGARDGGAPKFFCGSGQDVFIFHEIFCPEPAYRRLFGGSGRDGGFAIDDLRPSRPYKGRGGRPRAL
jgi:hypothetical protein